MFKRDPCFSMSTSPHSPHNIIPSLISSSTTALDVGCNTGYFAKTLNRKEVITDGIDINKSALKVAQKYCRKVFVRDLYSGKLSLPKKKYDYIIFADVLEHLPRPDLILTDSKKYLANNGTILISLPNIARVEIRFQLLMGKFNYTTGGILSQDHLRFFTKESAIKMINGCGLKVQNVIPTGLGHIVGLFDTLTAFQFVYQCVKMED